MAGMGPPPKPPALRHRTNASRGASKRRTLAPEAEGPIAQAPALPRHPKGHAWHARVRAWWADLWVSPVAAVYLRIDVHGLLMLAHLRDTYWKGSTELASEIRLQDARFGLDPMARLRLQLQAPKKGRVAEAGAGDEGPRPPAPRRDPRHVLRVLEGPRRPDAG